MGLESDLFISGDTYNGPRTARGYCRSRLSYDKIVYLEDWVCSSGQVEEGYEYFGEDSIGCSGCIQDANGYYWDEWDDFDGDCNFDGIGDGGLYFQEFTCAYYSCAELGDVNSDGIFNVLDIVGLVNCVLASGGVYCNCAADLNEDGTYNVLDVVVLVNCVFNGTCG
jgi:hypothetical protein